MATTAQQPLAAELLRDDPRLAEARRMILDAVAAHQQSLNEIRPASPDRHEDYQAMLDQFGQIRGGPLYFPYLSSGLGNGPFVELADGSVKLDMITGIGVHGLGHSHPALVEAGIQAAISDTVMQGNLQQATDSFEFAKLLTETANESGGNLDHCFLTTSGAMANENALKMAFQKNHPANRIVAFEQCFAGRTLVLSQVTDKAKNRVGLPETIAVDFIPFFSEDDPAGSTQAAVNRFQEHLKRYPGKIAVLWMELIQGEGGYHVGSPSFFKALIDLAHEHGIAVVADEIQTFGRTTRPFAFQHFELDGRVDLVTVGKITQVCATLFTDAYRPQPGLISQTFTGSSWAIKAGTTVLRYLIDHGHFGSQGKNIQLHQQFQKGLEAIGERHPGSIQGPFGIGGMVAFTPFDGRLDRAKQMVNRMYDAGLMSFIAGADPVRIRFLMPLGATEPRHIEQACQIVESVVVEMNDATPATSSGE